VVLAVSFFHGDGPWRRILAASARVATPDSNRKGLPSPVAACAVAKAGHIMPGFPYAGLANQKYNTGSLAFLEIAAYSRYILLI
jgi:hypothetical protein